MLRRDIVADDLGPKASGIWDGHDAVAGAELQP